MKNIDIKQTLPVFWSFIERYDQDFWLDYKNEEEYYSEFTNQNADIILELKKEIASIEKSKSETIQNIMSLIKEEVHGLNFENLDHFLQWLHKLDLYFQNTN